MKKLLNFSRSMFLLLFCPTFAFAGDDPFEPAQKVTTEIFEFLTGNIAITIVAIAIVGCGYSCLTGKMQRESAVKVVVGAIVIGCAFQFAELLLQK